MHQVFSSGVILFRKEPRLSFLLMRHARRYDLPKGHREAGENDLQCALRELFEETGIPSEEVHIDPDFSHAVTYYPRYRDFQGAMVEKRVTLFLAFLRAPRPIVVTEHIGHEWFDWNPPHRIEWRTIDSALAAVHEHWSKKPDLAPTPAPATEPPPAAADGRG